MNARLLLMTIVAAVSIGQAAASPRMVFAHYVMWNVDYGASIGGDKVQGYMLEMRHAQAAGIDGFVLDLGAWSAQPYYIPNMDDMFEAAARLNSGFKLFYSADFGSKILTADDVRTIVRRYGDNPRWSPYYFRYNGRPVLTTFLGQNAMGTSGPAAGQWWLDNILTPLKTGIDPGATTAASPPIDVFFVPLFVPLPSINPELPTYNEIANAPASSYNAWWKNVADGLFYWGIAGLPTAPAVDDNGHNLSTTTSSQAYARVAHENGKLYMAPCALQFWAYSGKTVGRRYYEYSGGQGLRNKWMSIIDVEKPEWVELVTWNDFYEATHWSPIDDPTKYGGVRGDPGFIKSHAGAYELLKYYIQWYKTGEEPRIASDEIYWFYRTQPMDAEVPQDPLGPVSRRYGPVADDIYVTCNLTAPATLKVTTGGITKSLDIPAGSSDVSIPFDPGAQSFELDRNGSVVLQGTGDPIEPAPAKYDYIYTTGFAAANH